MSDNKVINSEVMHAQSSEKLNYFQKLWRYKRYLVVEPYIFFYVMASVFNAVAIQNFSLEKACRVNMGHSKVVCDAILDKSVLGIECDVFDLSNATLGCKGASNCSEMIVLDKSSLDFNYTVCRAEVEAQILASDVSGKRAPIAAIFPLIILLFAGGWSDRYNKRKPCMIIPIVGEMLSFGCLLISAIFFDQLPMEFGAYLEAIIPNLFGGITFSLMAVYSYITITTPEEDRVFRFGVFAMFINAVPFIGQPISGLLFQSLGYVFSFLMAFVFQAVAILYIIFFIEEVTNTSVDVSCIPEPSSLTSASPMNGIENTAYESEVIDAKDEKPVALEVNGSSVLKPPPSNSQTPTSDSRDHHSSARNIYSLLREFFDPALIIDCIKFPLIKRPKNGRMLLGLLLTAYFLTVGPSQGENDYWYRYTLKKHSWNGNDFSVYFTFVSAAALVGTFIGTAIFSKLLKFSDSMIGIISSSLVVLSRIIFAFSGDTISFYIGGLADMFVSLRVIAIKSISSCIISGEELSKMYSIFGISEPIGQFVFAPIYSAIYKNTVDFFPGAIFLFSEIFYVLNIIVFILCYIILRRNKLHPVDPKSDDSRGAATTEANLTPSADCEVTNL